VLALTAPAQATPPRGDGDGGFVLREVADFILPIDAENAPGFPAALFVAEQGGRIEVVKKGAVRPTPFLDISDQVQLSFEEGLISFAFHPRYRENRVLYVYFTNEAGDNVVMEFKRKRRKPYRVNHASARTVLTVRHPFTDMHNGGELAFGPDGLLYLSTGDGGGQSGEYKQAQKRGSLLGKLLRINPRPHRGRPYSIPEGNPFRGGVPGRGEIYSVGLRNPFRFSFDPVTGAISIGDVGAICIEEIDYRRRGRARGANFGWSRFEGTVLVDQSVSAPHAILPIFQYGHNHPPGTAFCAEPSDFYWGHAVIVGYVVRDPRLRHQYGRLLFSDFSNPAIGTLIPKESGARDAQLTGVSLPAGAISFAEGAKRRLYAIASDGTVYRLDPAP